MMSSNRMPFTSWFSMLASVCGGVWPSTTRRREDVLVLSPTPNRPDV